MDTTHLDKDLVWEILKYVRSPRSALRLAVVSKTFCQKLSVMPRKSVENLYLSISQARFTKAAIDWSLGEEFSEISNEEGSSFVWQEWIRVKEVIQQKRFCIRSVCTKLCGTKVNMCTYTQCLRALEHSLDEDTLLDILSSPSSGTLAKLGCLHALARRREARAYYGNRSYPLRLAAKAAYLHKANETIELIFYERGFLDSTSPFRARDRLCRNSISLDEVLSQVCDLGLCVQSVEKDPCVDTVAALKLLDAKCWAHRISGLREPKLTVINRLGNPKESSTEIHNSSNVHWAHQSSLSSSPP